MKNAFRCLLVALVFATTGLFAQAAVDSTPVAPKHHKIAKVKKTAKKHKKHKKQKAQ